MAQEYTPPKSDNTFTIPTYGEVVDGEDVFRRFSDDVCTSPPNPGSRGIRQTFISTANPDNALGLDGDVWLKYV